MISSQKSHGTQNCGPQTCVPNKKILSLPRKNFLRALCDGVTGDFGSKSVLETYNLGTKSNITRIKSALQGKELIDYDKNGVYLEDPVFKMWFKGNK